jgi:hypothetical protein
LRKSSRVREGVVLDTSPRSAWSRRSSIKKVDANIHSPALMVFLFMNSTKSTVHSIVCRDAWKKPGVHLKMFARFAAGEMIVATTLVAKITLERQFLAFPLASALFWLEKTNW